MSGSHQNEAWSSQLRRWREATGHSREALATLAGVSSASIKAYENGVRRPTRESLLAVLDALSVEPVDRGAILRGLGFIAVEQDTVRHLAQPEHSLAEARAEIDAMPWPAHVSNEVMAVVAANQLAQAVWGVDLSSELDSLLDRSLVASLSQPRFADRLVNWEEAMRLLLSLAKGSFGEPGDGADSNQYFAAVFAEFLKGDPKYVQAAIRIWAEVEPRILKWRFSYPVEWEHPTEGRMRFKVLVNPVNRQEHITINDWMPLDAATWDALARLRPDHGQSWKRETISRALLH